MALLGNALRVKSTEVVPASIKADGKAVLVPFTPGKTTMPLLDGQGGLYDRWQIQAVTVKYVGTCSVTSGWEVRMGIDFGTSTITADAAGFAKIASLTPHRLIPAYKTASIPVSRDVMPSRFLLTNGTGHDAVAFTVALGCSADATVTKVAGYLEITYDLLLQYPTPK